MNFTSITLALFFVLINMNSFNAKKDSTLLERIRRDVTDTDCGFGMNQTVRSILDQTLASQKTWNCSLEQEAGMTVQQCLTDNGGLNNGTLKLSYTNTYNSTPEDVLVENTNAIMIAAQSITVESTTTIGCSYANCDSRVDLLCIYN